MALTGCVDHSIVATAAAKTLRLNQPRKPVQRAVLAPSGVVCFCFRMLLSAVQDKSERYVVKLAMYYNLLVPEMQEKLPKIVEF